MEKLWMTQDGFALLFGGIVGVAALGIAGAELEMAWERWKKRKRKGV